MKLYEAAISPDIPVESLIFDDSDRRLRMDRLSALVPMEMAKLKSKQWWKRGLECIRRVKRHLKPTHTPMIAFIVGGPRLETKIVMNPMPKMNFEIVRMGTTIE